MQIYLNNQSQDIPTDGIQYFGQLMEKLTEEAASEGGSVLNVRLNGEDITGRDKSNFEQMSVGEIENLEVETGDPKTLARSTLYSIADFHEQLLKELQITSEFFRMNNIDRSNESFLRCIDGLQVFMHTMESCRKLLGLSFELLLMPSSNTEEEISVAESRRSIFTALDGIIEAQTDQDWVLLADIMEFELTPSLAMWREVIQMILEKTAVDVEPPPVAEVVETQSAAAV